MNVRPLIPILALAALSASSSAATATVRTTTLFSFTVPSDVQLFAADPTYAINTSRNGLASAGAGVGFPRNGVNEFRIETQASANAADMGIGSATSTGAYVFRLTNTTASKATVNLRFTYSQSTSLTSDAGPDDYAYSSIASNGFFTGGFNDILADAGSLTKTASETLDFSIVLNPFATRSFGFVNTSEAYVQAVPEPASLAALGLGAVAMIRRRKRA